jgi:hypothetical protein
LRPIKYDQIRDILNGLAERFDWDKIVEENNVIGLKQVVFFCYFRYETTLHDLDQQLMWTAVINSNGETNKKMTVCSDNFSLSLNSGYLYGCRENKAFH